MSTAFYIIAISFQIAGALLLMFSSISTKRRKVVEKFVNKDMVFEDGNTNEIKYSEGGLKDTFRVAYLTKLSFAYIALGYIIGILGENEGVSKIIIAIAIIGLTAIIIGASYFIIEQVLKHSKKVNKKLTKKELEEYDLEATMEEISNEEVDQLFNKIFKQEDAK